MVEKFPFTRYRDWESADELSQHRTIFEKHGVFPAEMIDDIIKELKSFNDLKIRDEIKANPTKMMELVNQYFHCG